MDTLVSVIMPAYNIAGYIAESIESIINQEYTDWELIVINDGSTDATPAIVRSFAQYDSRITLYDQKNQGVSATRNRGINIATGKYVAFLDGDDLWDASFLRKAKAAIEIGNINMAYSGFKALYEDGQCKKIGSQYMDDNILVPYLDGLIGIHIGSVLADRTFLLKHNILFTAGCARAEDIEFILKILCFGTIKSVPEELMMYRKRVGSATHSTFNWQTNLQEIEAYRRALQYIQSCENTSRDVLKLLTEKIGFYRYRLLWKMIKHHKHLEALEMLSSSECLDDLMAINKTNLRIAKQLQYSVIMSKNKYLWKACSLGLFK